MSGASPIYLDYNATTPLASRVLDAMRPYLTDHFGNASSRMHDFGRVARAAVEEARGEVAQGVGARPEEIVFTSGATESNNLALRGRLLAGRPRGQPHLITTAAEHPSVLACARSLERAGVAVTYLPVGRDSRVDPDQVAVAFRAETRLVSVMAVNNETGAINPLGAIGELCRARGVPLHTDATQALGKIDLSADALGADLASFSAHKLYGPKGIGALYIRQARPSPRPKGILQGGSQEGGLRPGTLNVPGIVGFGQAVALLESELAAERLRLEALSGRLLGRLHSALGQIVLNGPREPAHRVPGTLNLSIEGTEAEALLLALPDLALSTGAACATGAAKPSHVLEAMGLPEALIHASIRISLGRQTTESQIDRAAERIVEAARRLRARSPGQHGAQGKRGYRSRRTVKVATGGKKP